MGNIALLLAILLCSGLLFIAGAIRLKVLIPPHDNSADHIASTGSPAILVAYASQSGLAELLAWKTANALSTIHTEIELLSLSEVTGKDLTQYQRTYFIVSTTGDGSPPDNGRKFEKSVMRRKLDLSVLRYSVLALGDSTYENFCAFGIRLNQWLLEGGATPLHDLILVDNADDYTLKKWQSLIWPKQLRSQELMAADITRWRLGERRILNLKSDSQKLYMLTLYPKDPILPDWDAGDVAQVYPARPHDLFAANSPQPREYTIASIPQTGALDLIVRQRLGNDGDIGICSRWLTETVAPGETVCLCIRRNPKITTPPSDAPYILIGAGSGMAGLRSQLQARVRSGANHNWVVYGERNPKNDRILENELDDLSERGYLQLYHQAFSRAGTAAMYVQDCLREHRDHLFEWVEAGAYIYVCGTYDGMGRNVHLTLMEILGEEQVEILLESSRYCRDTY